jgi:hypothetical protein
VGAEHEPGARAGIELVERASIEHRTGASCHEVPEQLHAPVFGVAELHFVSGL